MRIRKCLFFFWLQLLSLALLHSGAFAFPLDFTTFRLGNAPRVVLIVGGIQGDEPGGFSAATLLATHYEISRGALWVVPNLNFASIIKRSRGLYGDMNRKFALLDEKDPEFDTVRRIQELIAQPQVCLVLNLHDGSGYYRPNYVDKLNNPSRWGQSIIIDQENMADNIYLGSLDNEANEVADIVNSTLIDPAHKFHVHNTNTFAGDREMEKSLSYFAVRKNKAAFGLETSKELPVSLRAYYHLVMIEAFLKMAGIEFKRNFDLSAKGVNDALKSNLGISFAENKIFIPLEDVRSSINFFPLPKDSIGNAITSKPIMAVLPCEKQPGQLCVHYGNRMVTLIKPDWREIVDGLDAVKVEIDGEEKLASFGQILDVSEVALIKKIAGYRVNAIGVDKGLKDESELPLRRNDFAPRFSLDRSARIFRIEIYKGKSLANMFLLRFGKPVAAKGSNLPDAPGPESQLGF